MGESRRRSLPLTLLARAVCWRAASDVANEPPRREVADAVDASTAASIPLSVASIQSRVAPLPLPLPLPREEGRSALPPPAAAEVVVASPPLKAAKDSLKESELLRRGVRGL